MKQFLKEYGIFEEYLKKNGLKLTQQRFLILDSFLNYGSHISAEVLFKKTRTRDAKIGFATVYRTLKHLIKCQLARELDFGNGRVQYEPEYNHAHHDHLICENCGRYIEFLNSQIEELQEQVCKKYRFQMRSHRMHIYGICDQCQKKER
jgi:Fur family ferric uptake transcriptional regulator